MNRVLAKKFREYLALNPGAVEEVFNKYGISTDVSISVESVVNAYQYFKEPFAVDLFNGLYPQIRKNIQLPMISAADPVTSVTDNPEAATKTSFWEGFAGVLNSLAAAAPAIADSVYTIKNGKPVVVPGNQLQPGIYPGSLQNEGGVNQNILIYIGIGFLALIVAILIFKKVK
ncbi:hypothetical protein [Lentimicrobium sp. S6]|uniref:hypothetical protein n=1 Tax=Lentimicrobium sp. S6 TaxID=2735872 RepID=UPI001554EE38|nr:hypothetical protein [Lentimicrobium sp. S6]NPD47484.1 hypothetical protein [Lentimicrobium sp. S6]